MTAKPLTSPSTAKGSPAQGFGTNDTMIEALIRKLEHCASLSDDEKTFLTRAVTRTRTLDLGEDLVQESGRPAECHLVLDGVLCRYKILPGGRRQITGFLERGDFIGLTRGATYEVGVEAITEVRLCRFSRRALLALMDDIRPLERALHDRTSNELVAAHDHMVLLGCKTARERVITFLLQRAGPAGTNVELPMTQTDIADYLGMRLETVSRAMHALLKEGLIERSEPHRIQILKPAMLREMAG